MSKCLKCGYELPTIGECVACAVTVKPTSPARSPLLDKDLRIDRRTSERTLERTSERPPSGSQPTVPSFSDLARGPTPPAPSPAALQATSEDEPETIKDAPLPAPMAPPPPATPRGRMPEPLPAPPPVRQTPAPVPVVTFAPTARPSPGPDGGEEPPPRSPPKGLPAQRTAHTEAPAPQRSREAGASQATPGVQEIHARPASLWRRLLSFGIDTAALVGVAALYITLASSITGVKAPASQGITELDTLAAWLHAFQSVLVPGFFLLLILALVYCTVAAFLWNGRTLGRLLLGLRLVDTHGMAPAPGRAIVRALLSAVSFGLFLGGFWMALFDRRGQTLHDKLTSTFVVQPS
ncbi:RDD family protein [Stigmatella sp. ncwal1]|uniref:RDD family protein n=1 Tax=Stigmatella ashevillensis TaxID=2995309 RepID=A0ABT5DII8_9BACT|nr:RDD family protein [Stigmatella ashevillena]MDC0713474.1 RDD family protein [Stigmatella ashevillena]